MTKRYDKPLTLEQMDRLSDDQIDTSDIPELDQAFWERAKVTAPRTKPNVSLRVNQVVVDFFKAENPNNYTTRIASVLSAYMQAHQSMYTRNR